MSTRAIERKNFGKIKEVIAPPNLIELQTTSYKEFLQADVPPSKRKDVGLQAVFREVFPVEIYDGKFKLDFASYKIGEPKMTWLECLREGQTYGAPLHVTFRLEENGKVAREEEVFMGELPLMTPQGSFVINGAERVIVSQLHRSPGIAFEATQHPNGKTLHSFRIIPDRGSWYEAQFDTSDLLYVYLDRKKRRRKFLTTTFFRALAFLEESEKGKNEATRGSDAELLKLFYTIEELPIKEADKRDDLPNKVLIEDVMDEEKGLVVARAFEPLSRAVVKQIAELGYKTLRVVDTSVDDGIIIKCIKKDPTKNEDEALKDIYRRLRPGDPPTAANARALIKRLFFDPKRYDLGRVGRYKINQKLNLPKNDTRILTKTDLVEATKYLLRLKKGEGTLDDIDHLGSRRVRTVGELLANQCRVGLARTERLVKERMTLFDQSLEAMTPQKLINPKALSAVIRDFFGRSQLSQFMDQINPLAELTHKRRLSALGPGGLSRDRAGFEVRDVHPSHYGRICPVETPEGPNIGLIASLATFARVNEFGFLETPYRKVEKGRVTDEIEYLTADREENYIVAQANAPIDEKGHFTTPTVTCRRKGDFVDVEPAKVNYMDVSPKQLVSVAASLIPFLEHDDANRALMGSNMQRQAVPLLVTETPLVATGLEERVARDSCAVVVAEDNGKVASVTGNQIIITRDGKLPEGKRKIKHDPENGIYVYGLRKFMRSNAATCVNQKALVNRGDTVKKGQVIADGPCTAQGELALGRNVLVAFMPWNGYNFEDAILISERIVKEDIFTSIHIDEFEVSARDTKLGPEEITRDIPNLGEEALKNLGPDGVIRVGAEVKPGDILVGKITPKSETELAPEERLLRAIFGEKAADVKDTSLKVPSGTYGIVMDVKVSAKKEKEGEKEPRAEAGENRRAAKQVQEEYRAKTEELREQLTEALSNILLGEKIPLDVVNSETGEIIIPANRKITKTLLRKLALVYDRIEIDPSPIRNKINEIIGGFKKKFEDLQSQLDQEMERVEAGDEIDAGIIKMVKVYIASKRKLSVGDKMAGRHGNKGVVAKIVPEEDMPFLADGTPVDIVLNPLGVPSRMNVGQVLETHLGYAARLLGLKFATPVFDGIKEKDIWEFIKQAAQTPVGREQGLQPNGKARVFDGRTGEPFDQEVVVGYIYMMKLGHLVADKIHARAVGPYSLVTQQPLGGKAQYGGQRFGEMEVWAMEAYGAAYTLQELLTVKSDDVQGRTRIYESIVKGDNCLEAGIPESFNVLVKEMQSLGLDVKVGYTNPIEHQPTTPAAALANL
ncbi:DNA-directed RNA polymerase subunit beta [Fontisphaera persica]|uniref:DNA-directed RNA polymerase subunit beta n=1 Tax=Fontisphaera persica TaxID=2974023 RepID=UPI0024BF88F1|nr:DNA-directed RNA polymerase subunit beta [Fontisphaera persica]WCJ59556.1 DNA-directed RNA polymerase subunit beta [Fontisphaera persica]